MPDATFELSAPLPWKRVLRLAGSVDFKPHEDDFQRFVKNGPHRSAQQHFVPYCETIAQRQNAGRAPILSQQILGRRNDRVLTNCSAIRYGVSREESALATLPLIRARR